MMAIILPFHTTTASRRVRGREGGESGARSIQTNLAAAELFGVLVSIFFFTKILSNPVYCSP